MPIKRNFGEIAGIITLLALVWGTYFIARSLFETNNNTNQLYIPTDATMVIRLDGRQLFSQGFSEVILDKKDNELLALLLETGDDKNATNAGINFLSDAYLFKTKNSEGKEIMGILVNLNSAKKFKSDIPQFIGANQIFAVKNATGLILANSEDGSISRKELSAFANKLLQKASEFDPKKLKSLKGRTAIIQVWAKKFAIPNHDIVLTDVSVSLGIHADSLTIRGKSSHSSEKEKHISWVTKDSDFYLESAVVPEIVSTFLGDVLLTIGLDTPPISHLCLNHRHTEHTDIGNTVLIPHFDASVSFVDTIDLRSQLDRALEAKKIASLTDTDFMFGGKQFYYKQLTPQQVYLGRNKPINHGTSNGVLFKISGSPKPFSQFQGDGLVMKLMKMSELYISSDQFFQRIENMDIKVQLTTENSCSINGEVTFEKGDSPLDAILNYLVRSGLL
ncbi:MAG: hypothetical protein ACI865_002491 [Flavobacteriaceae bacterium]|jgi:hypothetical protein